MTFAKTSPSTVTTAAARRAGRAGDTSARAAPSRGRRGRSRRDHLEHGRARVAGQQADVEGGEHERRQEQVLEGVPSESTIAVEHGVDRVEARDAGRGARDRVEPASARQPFEPEEEDVEGDSASQKVGIEMPRERDDAQAGRGSFRRSAATTPSVIPTTIANGSRERELRRRRDELPRS